MVQLKRRSVDSTATTRLPCPSRHVLASDGSARKVANSRDTQDSASESGMDQALFVNVGQGVCQLALRSLC